MKKSVDILDLSIISIGEGKELGTAKGLVIDAVKGEVAAIVVEDGEWYLGAKILPFEMIQGIGEYALTVENSSAVIPLGSVQDFIDLLKANIRIKGTKVLSKDGKMHGQVTEILIDEQSGKITGCEVMLPEGATTIVPAEQVITFGQDVLVIKEEGVAAPLPAVLPGTASPIALDEPLQKTVERIITISPEVKKSASALGADAQPASKTKDDKDNDDINKKFDEKQRKFVLGKKATRRIEASDGAVVVDKGEEITNEVIQKAKNNGKFIELTMSITP